MSVPGDVLELVTLDQLLHRPAWHAQAACRGMGTELWFPERGGDVRAAKAICSGCPVAARCDAAGDGEHGIWAGHAGRAQLRPTAA